MTIGLNLENSFVGKEEIENIRPLVERSHHLLEEKTGAGSKYLGWMDLPGQISKEELKRINKVAEKIKNNSDIFI
ncbi:MAG TPA: glucose-6-phosphate isomerase, partial [Tissierellaceae bacterium]|nr:glucose-6-phosphate isomerase [Tissierellaceae bacterium]